MRFLLDTNILAHLVKEKQNEISNEVSDLILDFSNRLYTSSLCILELLQLYRIGKIKSNYKNTTEMIKVLQEQFYIEILPFHEKHTEQLATMNISQGHNDPFDHAIIAQSISDKLILISSDRKFQQYTTQGLELIFNER